MMNFTNTTLSKIIVHKIGNSSRDEGVKLSKSTLSVNGLVKDLLAKYFLNPFKVNEYYSFFHESDISLNEMFTYTSQLFSNPNSIAEQSEKIAKHLYEKSSHPKIKNGELYVVYLKECLINDEVVDAVGIFKSESKETFLKVYATSDNYMIEHDEGIDIHKLDKGCIIFNTHQHDGYMMAIVDNINKSFEAQYWRDEFLHIKEYEDSYYQTQKAMQMCKSFVVEKLPETFNVDRADQAEILNKSLSFFKEKSDFSFDDFAQEVIAQPEIIDEFHRYKHEFEDDNDIKIEDSFSLSENAVSKQSKIFKSVLKLDKNFTVYIHGNRQNIVKGFDEERNKNFYQVYYDEEN